MKSNVRKINMRLEIIIPDSTRQDLKTKLARLTKRLSADPALVDEIMTDKAEAVPDYAALIDQIRQSPNRFKSGADVDAHISKLRAEW